MATLTGTKVGLTEFAGDYKILVVTCTLESASDVVNITQASHGIDTILGVIGCAQSGLDAELVSLAVSFSSLAITITSIEEDGTASTAWGQVVTLFIIGK